MVWLLKYLTRWWNGRKATRSASSPKPGGDGRLAHQTANDLRISLRSPRARFMTFIFPSCC
jgi:hypothetical protein